ncbi:DUF6199 family natural product biosynthesis protein [Sporosarcina sp. BP05]|uniref:DUF6199 family natural product biosynthesis protein n=1 Tax=Sporosarcina sp. BP05 TaxID=2758726 RepID=UPI0016455E88|nr:DUF6199 family natural product biosynthesis protein [Sporosarcina sp. BP05]
MVLQGVFLLIAGVTMIVKPSILWLIAESWKSNDGTEPSDFYNGSTRFGGILMTIAGIGGIIASLL